MNDKTETVFADGFFFDRPREGAPDFVKGRMSIKVEEAIPFLQKNVGEKGYVNLDLLLSKKGSLYLKLNTFTPKKTENDRNIPMTPVGDMDFSKMEEALSDLPDF